MQHTLAYGIDLAGYSSKGKSQVAKVLRINNENSCYLSASLIPTNLLKSYKGIEPIMKAVKSDVEVFSDILINGGICAVDVPIDLQGINKFTGNKTYIWEATKRSIDYCLGALPPLADKIGAVVARMQLIMEYFPNTLGNSIFETYPAASLFLLGEKQQYKGGKAKWQSGTWMPIKKDEAAHCGLSNLLNNLQFVAVKEGLFIDDDQFDAILAAIPLLSQSWLIGSDLIKHPLLAHETLVDSPKGYILCDKKFWSRIEVQ